MYQIVRSEPNGKAIRHLDTWHFACAACFLLSACAGPAAEQSSVQPPYDGQIQDADVFIDMPNLRQYGGYTCGTTCVQMVMNWLDPYQADWNLAAYEEELGTNEEAGTPPGSIVSFFEENSVTVTAKENRTTSELASALYQGHPVLLCIQAWAAAEDGYNTQNSDDADTYLAEGTGSSVSATRSRSRVMYFTLTIRRALAIA